MTLTLTRELQLASFIRKKWSSQESKVWGRGFELSSLTLSSSLETVNVVFFVFLGCAAKPKAVLRYRIKGCQACLNRTWDDGLEPMLKEHAAQTRVFMVLIQFLATKNRITHSRAFYRQRHRHRQRCFLCFSWLCCKAEGCSKVSD